MILRACTHARARERVEGVSAHCAGGSVPRWPSRAMCCPTGARPARSCPAPPTVCVWGGRAIIFVGSQSARTGTDGAHVGTSSRRPRSPTCRHRWMRVALVALVAVVAAAAAALPRCPAASRQHTPWPVLAGATCVTTNASAIPASRLIHCRRRRPGRQCSTTNGRSAVGMARSHGTALEARASASYLERP